MKSGDSFEKTVSVYSILTTKCVTKKNYRFYSPRIYRGTETDVIVITKKKIYCVECKNFNGFIRGSRLDVDWVFASSGCKGKVFNPILSNEKHIRTIRGLLRKNNMPVYEIQNIVCVPNGTRIHTECEEVFHLSSFLRILKEDSLLEDKYDVLKVSKEFDRLQ